jgi:multidrug transporter EmrE-like cation transporter
MLKIILEAIPVLVFSYAGQVLMKRGVNAVGGLRLSTVLADPVGMFTSVLLNWSVMAGFILAGIGAIFYLFLLSADDFTVVFPILGALGFLVLPVIGYVFLQETSSPARIMGTIIIAVGMLVVSRG